MGEWKQVDFDDDFPFDAFVELIHTSSSLCISGRFVRYFGEGEGVNFFLDEPQLPKDCPGIPLTDWTEFKWRLSDYQYAFHIELGFSNKESDREKVNEIIELYPKVKTKRAKRAKKERAA